MKRTHRQWLIPILCAAAIALIIISSDVMVASQAGKDYYPFHYFTPSIKTLDFTMYSAIVEHVSLTGWVGEPQIFEFAGQTPSREWLPFLIGGFLRVLSGDYWIIIIKLIGAISVFLLAWLIFGRWTEKQETRILLSTLFALFPNIFDLASPWLPELVANIAKFLSASSLFLDRFHSPLATLPFFLLSLYLTFRAFDTKKRTDAIMAGVCAGLLIYTYFYYISFFAGLLIALLFEWKESRKKGAPFFSAPPRHIIWIFIAAAIIALPYVLNVFHNISLGFSADMLSRLGLDEVSRAYYTIPTLKYLALLGAAILVIKKWDSERAMLAGMLAFSVAAMNAQLLTGFNLSILHWQNQVADQVSLFFMASLLPFWKAGRLRLPKISLPERFPNLSSLAIPATIILLLFGFVIQLNSVKYRCSGESTVNPGSCNNYTISPYERAGYEWLKANASANDVVLSLSAQTNARISADTGLYVYYPNGFLTTARNSEIERRVAFAYRFFGVNRREFAFLLSPQKETLGIQKIQEPIKSDEDLVMHEKALIANFPFHFLYHATILWQKKKFETSIAGWPEAVRKEITEAGYEGNNFFYSKEAAERLLSLYDSANPQSPLGKISFVWAGKYERLVGDGNVLGNYPFLEKALENPEVTIYRFIGK